MRGSMSCMRGFATWSILALTLIALAATCASAQKSEDDPCLSLHTQAAMNDCEIEQSHKADIQLREIYEQLLSKYKSNTEFIARLKLAQKRWLAFRKADLGAFYYQGSNTEEGTVFPMCESLDAIRLTEQRIRELRQMLHPTEGDVCAFYASSKKAGRAKPAE